MFKDSNTELGHLYVFRQAKGLDSGDDWQGRINATNTLIKETRDKIYKEVKAIKVEVDTMNKTLKSDLVNEMKEELKKELANFKDTIVEELKNEPLIIKWKYLDNNLNP